MDWANDYIARCQVPALGQLVVDHVAHFTPNSQAAAEALAQLGFSATPFSPQSHRPTPDSPLTSAGTGNICVMLRRGYLEFLTPTADTPIAGQLRDAIARYIGVHLVALGTADPDSDRTRLAAGGFNPLPVLALERPIVTPDGEETAAFAVTRVPAGTMPEGRIQFVQQKTARLLWQRRWLDHPNRAFALAGVYVCVADPIAAAARYERYLGLASGAWGDGRRIASVRGSLIFMTPEALQRTFGVESPMVPWIAGYALECGNVQAARSRIEKRDVATHDLEEGSFFVIAPPVLGGLISFGLIGHALPTIS